VPTGPRNRKDAEELPDHIKPYAAVPGQVRCLGACGLYWESPDPHRVRVCPACKASNDKTYLKEENSTLPSEWGGGYDFD